MSAQVLAAMLRRVGHTPAEKLVLILLADRAGSGDGATAHVSFSLSTLAADACMTPDECWAVIVRLSLNRVVLDLDAEDSDRITCEIRA